MNGGTYRPINNGDWATVERLSCATSNQQWDVEVESFIRTGLRPWMDVSIECGDEPRVLVILDEEPAVIVGIGAHAKSELRDSGFEVAARRLQVAALNVEAQGGSDAEGNRYSSMLISALIQDAQEVDPGARIYALVHRDNARSLGMLARAGLVRTVVMPPTDYVIVLE